MRAQEILALSMNLQSSRPFARGSLGMCLFEVSEVTTAGASQGVAMRIALSYGNGFGRLAGKKTHFMTEPTGFRITPTSQSHGRHPL